MMGSAGFVVPLFLLIAPCVEAHDQWLELDPFRATKILQLKVYLQLGEHFTESEPARIRRRERVKRFELHSATERSALSVQLREDQEPLASLDMSKRTPGTYVLALDTSEREIELEATKFQEYLLEERLIDILASRAENTTEDFTGRERYSRCLKSILQLGATPDATATKVIGQELEIVPVANPYSLDAGATLAIQVLFKGNPLPHRAVMAANRYRSKVTTRTMRTDDRGMAHFKIDRKGDWMIRLVHMQPSSEPGVDWRSWWTSLTFSLAD